MENQKLQRENDRLERENQELTFSRPNQVIAYLHTRIRLLEDSNTDLLEMVEELHSLIREERKND